MTSHHREVLGRTSPDIRPLAETSVGDDLVWAVVDAAPDGMVVIDERGTIELVNTRIEEMFGYHRSELLGQPVEILVPESVRVVHRAHRTRFGADPSPRPMGIGGVALRGRRADGSDFPVEISLSPVSVSNGAQRVVAAIRDVTKRLEIERYSRTVRYALDTAVDGIFIADEPTLEFSYVNQQFAHMHGYSIVEMIGMTPMHLTPHLNKQQLEHVLEPLIAGDGEGEGVTLNVVTIRKDGVEFPVEVHINRPAAADVGEDRPFVAIVRDVTDRLKTEKALADARALTDVIGERERLARDLHDQVIGDLFGVGLKIQATIGAGTDEQASQRLRQSVDALDNVINLVRSTIFGLTHRSVDTSVVGTLDDLLSRLTERLGHRPTLTTAGGLDDLPAPLLDDAVTVITEALTNCAKHANATATTVDVDVSIEQLSIVIADNGDGFADNGSDRPGGLGVNNMHFRATAHGGSCTLESSAGKGVTVTWTVPISRHGLDRCRPTPPGS